MLWKQLKIITTAANAEILSELLLLVGAVAVTFEDAQDQPIYEPHQQTPLWEQTCVCGLFENSANLEKTWELVQQKMDPKLLISYQSEIIPDKDWVKDSQHNFPPLKFGKRLWICPSWETISEPNAVIVQLDPGLAFGTGTHPTTALCLEWLEVNVKSNDSVIDYGCGSGILAIAASKLGAKTVWAIDHDPQALQATRENALRNQITAEKLITTSPENSPEWQADILVANILAQPLIELAALFARLTKPQGRIVLSGILREQAKNVATHYSTWFKMSAAVFKEEWARLEGVREIT